MGLAHIGASHVREPPYLSIYHRGRREHHPAACRGRCLCVKHDVALFLQKCEASGRVSGRKHVVDNEKCA